MNVYWLLLTERVICHFPEINGVLAFQIDLFDLMNYLPI